MNRALTAALCGTLLAVAAPAPAHAAASTTGTLAGQILTNSGAPAAGATVGLAVPRAVTSTTTDAAGNFQLANVPPGSYHAFVQRQPIGAPRQWVPRQTTEAASSLVTIEAGRTARIDERLLPLGVVTGTYTGPDGPIANAFVQPDGDTNGEAVTAADGSYTLYVWVGDHRLRFDPFDSDREQWATGARTEADATVYAVAEDQVVRHDERQMADGTLAGRLLDYTGAPLPGPATVVLVDSHGTEAVTTTTDDAGNWQVAAFPDDYQVRFQYGNRWESAAGQYTVLPGATTTVPLEELTQPGDLRLTLTVNGTAAQTFCLTLWDDALRKSIEQCTEEGTVTFEDVSPITFSADISAPPNYWYQTDAVAVVAGRLTTATLAVVTQE
jgi:hypothetical protein